MADQEEPAIVRTDKRKITPEGEVRFPSDASDVPELTEEQKAELLAAQAAEYEAVPYEGGGLQSDGAAEIPNYRTVFQVAVGQDGVPKILKASAVVEEEGELDDPWVEAFTYDRDPNNRDLYLACSEIVHDITMAETAQITATVMMQQAAGMARYKTNQIAAAAEAQQSGKKKR